MILDGEQVVEGVSKSFVKYPGEDNSAWLLRLSHLHCQNQGITKIADLSSCSNITVLYLYNNKIKTIDALESAPNIQLLYLQSNKISRISGLQKLTKLKKLYLTRNRVQVLEGLMENKELEEIHLDRQFLKPGEHFVMDPRNCQSLSSCLQILNISHSNIHDLSGVEQMACLNSLNASGNKLSSLDSILDMVYNLSMLSILDLRDNPQLNKSTMYRTKVIAAGRGLQQMDGRVIDQSTKVLAAQMTKMQEKRKFSAKVPGDKFDKYSYANVDTEDVKSSTVSFES